MMVIRHGTHEKMCISFRRTWGGILRQLSLETLFAFPILFRGTCFFRW